jgi:hypothetical protein
VRHFNGGVILMTKAPLHGFVPHICGRGRVPKVGCFAKPYCLPQTSVQQNVGKDYVKTYKNNLKTYKKANKVKFIRFYPNIIYRTVKTGICTNGAG